MLRVLSFEGAAGAERAALLYDMFVTGITVRLNDPELQRSKPRTLDETRKEASLQKKFRSITDQSDVRCTNGELGRMLKSGDGPFVLELAQVDHEFLKTYVEMVIPKLRPAQQIDALDTLDWLTAAPSVDPKIAAV